MIRGLLVAVSIVFTFVMTWILCKAASEYDKINNEDWEEFVRQKDSELL